MLVNKLLFWEINVSSKFEEFRVSDPCHHSTKVFIHAIIVTTLLPIAASCVK